MADSRYLVVDFWVRFRNTLLLGGFFMGRGLYRAVMASIIISVVVGWISGVSMMPLSCIHSSRLYPHVGHSLSSGVTGVPHWGQ